MRVPWAVAAPVVLLVGFGPPARAFGPAPSHEVVTIVSGDTGHPVPHADVTVDGRVLRADAHGEVPLPAGKSLGIRAAGYLPRQSTLPPGARTLTLWPTDEGYSADYVRSLLYKPAYMIRDDARGAPDMPLARIVAARVSVVPAGTLRRDAETMEAHRAAVATINDATAGRVRFVLEPRGRSEVVFRTTLDGSSSADALAYRDLKGGEVVGGKVVFATLAAARDPRFLAHELGHALGLQHSTVPTDMMYFACGDRSPYDFTENERRTIRLLLLRPPGNRFPDNDLSVVPATGSATSLRSTE